MKYDCARLKESVQPFFTMTELTERKAININTEQLCKCTHEFHDASGQNDLFERPAELNGGTIGIGSEEGKGEIFSFYLPQAKA